MIPSKNKISGLLCVTSDLSGYTSISDTNYKSYSSLITEITKNPNKIKYCYKSKNNKISIQNLLTKDYDSLDLSNNSPSILCLDSNFIKSKPNTKTCPPNYPVAFNMATGQNDTHPLVGAFCSSTNDGTKFSTKDSSFNLSSIPKNKDQYIGCNKTNLDLIDSSGDLYYSCKSNPVCPSDYPFSITGNKCCKVDPNIDIDNNCKNSSYTIDCPVKTQCKNNNVTTCANTKKFTKIDEKEWEKKYAEALKKKDLSLMKQIPGMSERCKWIKTCGRVWQGIDIFC